MILSTSYQPVSTHLQCPMFVPFSVHCAPDLSSASNCAKGSWAQIPELGVVQPCKQSKNVKNTCKISQNGYKIVIKWLQNQLNGLKCIFKLTIEASKYPLAWSSRQGKLHNHESLQGPSKYRFKQYTWHMYHAIALLIHIHIHIFIYIYVYNYK